MDIWKELRDEGVDSGLLDEVRRFREAHPLTPEAQERVPVPKYLYYGREVWESAAAALLCGEHLLLAGPKATGKNVLAEDLAALFGRPVWDVSMYVNVDAAALIGADTLKDGQVVFREGPVCACARLGGFGVLVPVMRGGKRGRNPKTGEEVAVPPHRGVTFHMASGLKASLNR